MDKLQLSEFWYSALRSPVGLEIATDNVEGLRSRLYEARKELADPDLDALFLTPSREAPEKFLWIMHKKVEVDDGQVLGSASQGSSREGQENDS